MNKMSILSTAVITLALVACGKKEQPATKVSIPGSLIVKQIEGKALSPMAARKTVKAGDDIILAGNIAGRKKPFVDGRAMFILAGDNLPQCGTVCASKCPTPWDLCCESPAVIQKNSATIQVLDANGKTLKADLNGHGGLEPGKEVIVQGRVQQIDENTFVVTATNISIK